MKRDLHVPGDQLVEDPRRLRLKLILVRELPVGLLRLNREELDRSRPEREGVDVPGEEEVDLIHLARQARMARAGLAARAPNEAKPNGKGW